MSKTLSRVRVVSKWNGTSWDSSIAASVLDYVEGAAPISGEDVGPVTAGEQLVNLRGGLLSSVQEANGAEAVKQLRIDFLYGKNLDGQVGWKGSYLANIEKIQNEVRYDGSKAGDVVMS